MTVDQAGVSTTASRPRGGRAARRRLRSSWRRRPIAWAVLAVAAVVAALIAVLTAAPESSVPASSPLIGKPAPPTAGSLIDGSGRASLGSLAGRWVLVNFFASWCQPCQQELPQLKGFAAQPGVGVLGIEYDPGDAGAARGYLAGQKIAWPVIADADADATWGVHGIPESYLVSPGGIVVAKFTGGVRTADLDATITRLSGGGR